MLVYVGEVHKFRREHLFVFDSRFLEFYPSDMSREIVLELSSNSNDFNIIDCGARILTDENGSNESACYTEEGDNLDGGKCTDCWSWLLLCFDLSHLLRFVSGRRR
ncbi:BnaC09g12640D [Brassica napus]|uniref:BnaC09g12640D protein n=1 Tax=Brassica napus TaxID=3708 RepID=A0A078F5E8_BRANA|nr:BnaC09g12640D [Brassica napus]